MKLFSRIGALGLALAGLFLMATPLVTPAQAVVALVSQDKQNVPNIKIIAYGDVTAAYANSTTGYTDVTGSSFTYTPSVNDCTTAGRVLNTGRTFACLIEVEWSLDVTKSTATTGTCAVYVNGAIVATSARLVASAAGVNAVMAGVLVVANTTVGTQTIKLQCKSADGNAITVNNGHVVVSEIITY